MPIDDLAPRYRELGRLKFGEDLGDRPAQLETWRLTSPDAYLIDRAAEIFGGVARVKAEGGAEVITETSELEVLIPPQDIAAGQFYELWKAGGLERRCTGTSLIDFDDSPAGFTRVAPCICEEENRAERECRISTTLRVLLPQLPDIGIWRLYTRSIYAAAEIPPAAEVLLRISDGLAPAILGLEKRTTKKKGSVRRNYIVPVLRSRQSLERLMASPDSAGLRPLPFDKGEPAPLPAPTPEHSPGASSPAEALWSDLRAFLEETPPGELPEDREALYAYLEHLEHLALETGLWTGDDPLDHAANVHLRGRSWRAASIEEPELRAFAQRALFGALQAFENHRAGRKMAGL